MLKDTTDFKEMCPTKMGGVGNDEFTPLLNTPVVDTGGFVESYTTASGGEVGGTATQQEPQVSENIEQSLQEHLGGAAWDSSMSSEASTDTVSEEDLQAAWDDGYAAGVTESGVIEANKFAAKLENTKKEYQSALGAITFTVDEIVLSDNLIALFKKYCDDVASTVFGQEISDELAGFILKKVEQFTNEIRAHEPTIEVTVSPQNFQNLKYLGSECVDSGIQLSENCMVYSSSSVTDNELCRVVANIDGSEIKADLNLSSVKQELDAATSILEPFTDDTAEQLGEQDGDKKNVGMLDGEKSALKQLMTSSLEGFDFDDLPPLDDEYPDMNKGLGR